MKAIYPDYIEHVLAEEATSGFPALNALDEHPKKVWKATSTTSWFRAHVGALSSGIGIFNQNAHQMILTLKQIVYGTATATTASKLIDSSATFQTDGVSAADFVWNHTDGTHTTVVSVDSETQLTVTDNIFASGEEYSVEIADIESTTYDLSGIYDYYTLMTDASELITGIFHEYDFQTDKINIVLTFSGGNASVEMGVEVAGPVWTFPDPKYGLSEGLKDYSIVKELNNGAFYSRPRDIVKTFSGSIIVERDRVFYDFMHRVAKECGPSPLAWLVSSNLTNQDWSVYAKFDGMPSGQHAYLNHSDINFNLLEVV